MDEPRGNSRRELRIKQRQEQAWQLRLSGLSQTEIARQLQVNQSIVSRDLQVAYTLYRQHHAEEANRHATIDLDRLDKLILAFWPKTLEGDTKAGAMVLKALERRAKMLGLESAQKVEFVSGSTEDADIERRLKEALGQSANSRSTPEQ